MIRSSRTGGSIWRNSAPSPGSAIWITATSRVFSRCSVRKSENTPTTLHALPEPADFAGQLLGDGAGEILITLGRLDEGTDPPDYLFAVIDIKRGLVGQDWQTVNDHARRNDPVAHRFRRGTDGDNAVPRNVTDLRARRVGGSGKQRVSRFWCPGNGGPAKGDAARGSVEQGGKLLRIRLITEYLPADNRLLFLEPRPVGRGAADAAVLPGIDGLNNHGIAKGRRIAAHLQIILIIIDA